MLTHKDIAETNDRNIAWYLEALFEECFGATDGEHVIDGLDGCGIGALIDHLQSGFFAVINASARLKDQLLVDLQSSLAQSATITLESFLCPWRRGRTAEKRDTFVSQSEQMLCGFVAAR